MNSGDTLLTEEQRAHRDVHHSSIALAAGAGCGKTTVLTDRFLAHLDGPDPLPLEAIVALTFTEKAARQLRHRIREACRDRLKSGERNDFWRGVLRSLESARIGTFHGFCGAILRQYPIEAGLEPEARVVEETIGPTLRDEALAGCIRRWLATGHPAFLSLAIDRGVPAIREALAGLLEKRAGRDVGPWLERTPTEIVEGWEAFRDGPGLVRLLRLVQRGCFNLFNVLEKNVPTHPVMQTRRIALLTQVPVLHVVREPYRAILELHDAAKVQGGGGKKEWPSEEIYEVVKVEMEKVRGLLKPLIKRLEPDDGRSLHAAEDGLRFARLAQEAAEAYSAAKRADGMIDFDDQLLRVRDLLRDGPARVREAISGSIGVLLVDEFQDTDAIQAEILERLAGDDLAGGRMFLVGDSKQSIYRFRGAQPALFETYRRRFPEDGRLNLTANFRSGPGILAFVNALFADAFPGEEHVLKPGDGSRDVGESAVEFLWAGSTAGATDRRQAEARAIASVLKRRLDAGWPIRDGQSNREASQGDVAILFRSLNDASIYEQALAAEGLDYHVVKGSAYFAQQEVIDLINVLSAIEDPHDLLALAGTMRGPFFGVSDDGLYWLAKSFGRNLGAGFDRWEEIVEFSESDRAVAGRAHRSLRRWRALKDREPIATLLARVLAESGFEAALLGEFLGGRKRANVRKMVKMAKAFDLHGGFTLADFVARLRADVKKPPREEQAATTDELGAAVRLMTIHQAKGLEFPIVVVPDLDRAVPHLLPSVTIHPILGPVARPCDGDPDDEAQEAWSLGWMLLKDEEQRAEEEEAIRLFYVAVTRARDALILSSGSDPAADGASAAMKLLASRFDRIRGDCTATLPEEWPRPRVGVIDAPAIGSLGRSSRAWVRPKLLVTARRIERSIGREFSEVAAPRYRPRFVDLEAARGLSMRALRREALLRAAATDPEIFDLARLGEVMARAAKSVAGWPSPAEVDAVRERLQSWLKGPLASRIAGADKVRRGLPWMVAWPLDDPTAIVFRGRLDLAFREASGMWTLAYFGLDVPAAHGRLNLLLGAYAADALGLGPVGSGLLICPGAEGGMVQIEDFGAGVVDAAIEDILR